MTDRIKWDARFLRMAELVSTWSKDPSTKCGAVIVRPDKTVASVGYNGFPKLCRDDEELYEDRNEKYGRVVHAEVNAILHAREPLLNYHLYTWWPGNKAAACDRCAAVIIQSGIIRVVTSDQTEGVEDKSWKESQDRALRMFKEAHVEVVSHPPLR